MGTINETIHVTTDSSGRPIVDPNQANIPDVNTGDKVVITWAPIDCTITGIQYTTAGAPPNPTQNPDGTWTSTYTAPSTPVSWNYDIETDTATPRPDDDIPFDPEINNVNPW